jgi:hypothetical protein
VGVLFAPESPRWLAGKGRWDEARIAIARLRGLKHDPTNKLVNADFKEMEDSILEQHSAGQGTWLECVTGQPSGIPRLVYRTALGCALQFAQQWTGVNYFFYVSLAPKPTANTANGRIVRRHNLPVCRYRRSPPGPAYPRCCERGNDNSGTLPHRAYWPPCTTSHRRPLASCLASHLRHHRYRPTSYRE